MRAAVLLSLGAILACSSPVQQPGESGSPSNGGKADVFGTDDRREVTDGANDQRAAGWARSTLVMVNRDRIQPGPAGLSRLDLPPVGQFFGLCSDEPFSDQPTAGHCSAFLVAEDLVVTAGHCMDRPGDCESFAFVFGFSADHADPSRVRSADIYSCVEIVGIENLAVERDWALVRLDRPVLDRPPLPVRRARAQTGDALTLIGYPLGVPAKIDAGGIVIESAAGSPTFRVTFDAYGGNSGSVVLDSATGEVVGVHVGGGPDFEHDPVQSCERSLPCPEIREPDCAGAVEVHADLFHDLLPQHPAEPPDVPSVPEPPIVNDTNVHRPGAFDLTARITGLAEGQTLFAAVSTGAGATFDRWATGTRFAVDGAVTFAWPELVDPGRVEDGEYLFRFFVDLDDNRLCDWWGLADEPVYLIDLPSPDEDVYLTIDLATADPPVAVRGTNWVRAPQSWGCDLFNREP